MSIIIGTITPDLHSLTSLPTSIESLLEPLRASGAKTKIYSAGCPCYSCKRAENTKFHNTRQSTLSNGTDIHLVGWNWACVAEITRSISKFRFTVFVKTLFLFKKMLFNSLFLWEIENYSSDSPWPLPKKQSECRL